MRKLFSGVVASRMLLGSALIAASVLAGCAQHSSSSGVYTRGQAQREQVVRVGTITSIRPVMIRNGTSGVGAVAGAAVGGVAGNSVGGGRGRTLTTIGGALLGAAAGNAIERRAGESNGVEITVRLDNGESRVVVQEDDQPIRTGQRVQMITGGGVARIVPM